MQPIGSSGTMWSQENKRGLLKHLPQRHDMDSLGSSEAVGLGASASAPGAEAHRRVHAGPQLRGVHRGRPRVEPGSGERGMVAVARFPADGLLQGRGKERQDLPRSSRACAGRVPGDWAEVNDDGTMKLLGRGSQVINTGGEKVFPEEVEEALKRHPAVRDAVVVGVPDARFGERICAVVEVRPAAAPTLAELADHVGTQLADYKAPRELVVVDRSAGRRTARSTTRRSRRAPSRNWAWRLRRRPRPSHGEFSGRHLGDRKTRLRIMPALKAPGRAEAGVGQDPLQETAGSFERTELRAERTGDFEFFSRKRRKPDRAR